MVFVNENQRSALKCLISLAVIWALLNLISMIFGRNKRRHVARDAAVGGVAGDVVAGPPGAVAGAGAGGAAGFLPVAGDGGWHGRSYDAVRALRDALLALLIAMFVLSVGTNYWSHAVRGVIIAFTVIAVIWALLRGFLHRFADFFFWPILASLFFYLLYRGMRGDVDD